MIASYAEAMAALYGRINYERLGCTQYSAQDLKLERMRRLLVALGNPHERLPVLHVAGTKGKGTVCLYLAALLQQAGYRVGLYTSPHMHRLEERFVVNGKPPREEQLIRLVQQLMDVVETLDRLDPTQSPTFFECVNALAWLHFQEQQVDLAVLEVGLGGRLDSTNVCRPLVTAITSISFDHTRILGHTLREIAGEKAGIFKPGVPAICGVTEEEPLLRIREQAERTGTPLRCLTQDFDVQVLSAWSPEHRQQTVEVRTNRGKQQVLLSRPGQVFAHNAAIALACLEELPSQGFPIPYGNGRSALAEVELPLRFEVLREEPLLIADCAHNPASLRALLQTTKNSFPGRPLTVLLAVSRDKDVAGLCQELAGCDKIIATQFQGNERALSAEQLHAELSSRGLPHSGNLTWTATPAAALETATRLAQPGEILLATGSLFFAAEIRALIHNIHPLLAQPA